MRTRTLILIAAVAGIGAGLAGIYGMSMIEGNDRAAAACMSGERLTAMEPLARGEVAAFTVVDEPGMLPALAFQDGEGKPRSLADWRGKTVLFNLWATWCAPCREEMPALDRLQAEMGKEDFEVVAVSIDRDATQARAFLDEIGTQNLALYTDTSSGTFQALKRIGRAFGMPTTLIVSGDGCELGYLAGPALWNSDEAKALVSAAAGRQQ